MSATIHLANMSRKAVGTLLKAYPMASVSSKASLNTSGSSNSIIVNSGHGVSSQQALLLQQQQKRAKSYYGEPQEFKAYNENLILVNETTARKWKKLPNNSKSSI